MPSLARLKLTKALVKKFGFEEVAGAKHDRFRLIRGNRKLVWTSVSRGSQYSELGPPIVSMIAKQLATTAPTLVAMVDCSVSAEEYERDLATGRSLSAGA